MHRARPGAISNISHMVSKTKKKKKKLFCKHANLSLKNNCSVACLYLPRELLPLFCLRGCTHQYSVVTWLGAQEAKWLTAVKPKVPVCKAYVVEMSPSLWPDILGRWGEKGEEHTRGCSGRVYSWRCTTGLHSRITTGSVQGTKWNAGNSTQMHCIQGKRSTLCPIFWPHC